MFSPKQKIINFSWIRWVFLLLFIIFITINTKFYAIQLNLTPSMPLGFYRASKTSIIQRGNIVSVCLPNHVAEEGLKQGYLNKGKCANGSIPVLKEVIAVPHDNVTLNKQGITVNKKFHPAPRQLKDSRGLAIKQFVKEGNYQNTQGYWLYGSHSPNDSWDSRYFGGIARENILHAVTPVWVFN